MPRDLFGDVTRPSISIGNRKWYTVPVSLLSHSIVIAMFVVLPIVAAPLLPGVFNNEILDYIPTVLPPPPAPPKPRILETRPIENPNAAPLSAPDKIAPEPLEPFEVAMTDAGVIGGTDDLERVLEPPPPVVAKPAPPQGPVRIGGTIRQPLKVRNVDPVYPAIAQAARVQGLVIIEATLSPDGRISNARVLKSIPLLDQAALDAVRQWEYTPTLLNGAPVPVIMTITVMFTLSR